MLNVIIFSSNNISEMIVCFVLKFIDGRLDILNEEKEPDDLFEEEILKCEAAAGACMCEGACVCVCVWFHIISACVSVS